MADRAMEEQQGAGQGDKPPASPLRAISAVLGAFVGIRKSKDRDADLASLKPAHVIIAGVIGAALFVTIIVTLVRLIAR
jgi:hypothetical protein